MQLWPAIDLRDGKCVRLEQGDYARETIFGDDPVKMARRWVGAGARRLHLVDLDGARDGVMINRPAVAEIVAALDIPCQLGGGVRDQTTIDDLLGLGLARLVVGTRAMKDPEWFCEMCRRHPGRLAAGIDARGGRVAIEGWQKTTETSAVKLARQFESAPIAAIIYTDIEKDGMLAGPNFKAVAELQKAVKAPIIASGGVSTLDDIRRLAELGVAGCIVGRALYEGKFEIEDALEAAGED